MAPETDKERIDREIIELLNELRVTLPGVQVLFAFLLVVPFQQRFATVTDLERAVYFFAVLATTAATALLIAPASYHRIRFRAKDKERMLKISNKLAIAGVACLAAAIAASVFLITEVVFGDAWAFAVAFGVVAGLGALWFGLPLYAKARDRG